MNENYLGIVDSITFGLLLSTVESGWPDHHHSKLENPARHFTAKIAVCEDLNYWERLKFLSIQSLERRREKVVIIFIWKCLQGYVKGYSFETSHSDRRGRLIAVPTYPVKAVASVRRAKEASIRVHGAQLFNCMLRDLRDTATGSVDAFRQKLESWLETIPDEPTIPNCCRAAKTNSIVDQVPTVAQSRL